MMRITGGEAKSRIIKVPQGIRPTQDKVRAAIFDILGERVVDTVFVDLFAGSGSVGIEALSRGARKVIFVEKSRRTLRILKENLKLLNYTTKSKVIEKDALKVKVGECDIIFADPPYDKGLANKVMNLFSQGRKATGEPSWFTLYSGKVLVLEHSKREKIEAGKHYKFGDTILTFIPNNTLIFGTADPP